MADTTLNLELDDFPPGPLDFYRKQSTFNWKTMRVFMEDEKLLKLKMRVWKMLEENKNFHLPQGSQDVDSLRKDCFRRMYILFKMKLLKWDEIKEDPRIPNALYSALFQYHPSTAIKFTGTFGLFSNTIRSLGSQRHYNLLEEAQQGKLAGSYAMTEIGHGSNTRGIQTTATYDSDTQEFVLHTADFEAAKCWAGSLGKGSTHVILFARLITPDGVDHGLHSFVTPLRDPNTLLPFPGVVVGDLGEKAGLNGIDNGFLMLNHYRIPRINLLDKTGDVTPDGKYVSPYKDQKKRLGPSLMSLSVGRVMIMTVCTSYLTKAVVIAVRYAAARKQFGAPSAEVETPLIEYQLHQWRLFPYLASLYVFKHIADFMAKIVGDFQVAKFNGDASSDLEELGVEVHIVSSAAKPLLSWVTQRAIQECREACGGHGYLKVSGLGDLRNDSDANITYEGENTVLIQQTSNYLLQMFKRRQQSPALPLGSTEWLLRYDSIIKSRNEARSVQDMVDCNVLVQAYDWLVCYLLESTSQRLNENLKMYRGFNFMAKNNSQVFYARHLAVAFIERFCLVKFIEKLSTPGLDVNIKSVLVKLCSLYGAWSLEQHMATLYEGGYFTGREPSRLLKHGILRLCHDVKSEAVSLADALAPPDFILNSVLGKSDGRVYDNLYASLLQNTDVYQRPAWWTEVMQWKDAVQSNL